MSKIKTGNMYYTEDSEIVLLLDVFKEDKEKLVKVALWSHGKFQIYIDRMRYFYNDFGIKQATRVWLLKNN